MNQRRRIFVGDVQGCREPLERLLERLRYDSAQDSLFLTGDLVSRGPDSLGALRLLKQLGARSVLGNHDAHLLDVARGREVGSGSCEEVLEAEDGAALIEWIESFPAMLHLKNVLLVHAAIRPGWGPLKTCSRLLNRRLAASHLAGVSAFADEDLRFALTARYCDVDGLQPERDWPPPEAPYMNWADLLEAKEMVVFGHFARQGLLERPGIRGLDTGCVHGGRLTAWIAEEDRLESVSSRKKR